MLSILFQEGRSSLNCASNDPILLRWMYELVGKQEILPHKSLRSSTGKEKLWNNLQGADHLSQCMITQSHGFLEF